jgi:hypothetical protein
VLKFYNTTYIDYQDRLQNYTGDLWNVRGMQLWNDWNLQVHEWATHQPNAVLDYLAMRSEDLIGMGVGGDDPEKTKTKTAPEDDSYSYSYSTRWHCLQTLAAFVGSTMSPQDVCCLAQREPQDFGASTHHNEHHNNFGAHPEDYETIGNQRTNHMRRGPKTSFNFGNLVPPGRGGADADEESMLDQQPLMMPPSSSSSTTTQQEQLQRLHQEEDVLKRLEVNLKKREVSLHQLDSDLAKREDSLKALEASLTKLQTSLNEQASEWKHKQQQEEKEDSTTANQFNTNNATVRHRRRRRRLQEHHPAQQVPTQFLKHFDLWKTTVEVYADTYQLETLHKLIAYGDDLADQWRLNAQSLRNVVDIREIESTIDALTTIAANKGENNGNSHGNGQYPSSSSNSEYTHARQPNHRKKVQARYGKYKAQLVNRTQLSNALHEQGKEGLQVFGYEPRVDWRYPLLTSTANSNATTTTFVCDASSRSQCS